MSPTDDHAAALDIRLLGPIEVLRHGQVIDLPGGRARSLLVLLALDAGRVVSFDRLVDDLWGEQPPASARTLVHGFVSRLRTVLEPHRDKGGGGSILETVDSGYRLAADLAAVDVSRFRRLLDEARSMPERQRASTLETALELWRGPALVDFAYEPFAQRAITSLDELRVSAGEDLMDAKLALGRHEEIIANLHELISAHPYRERLRGQLMLALYRAGRQADALEAFGETRRVLLEELGIDPGPALRDLEGRILAQDPGLDARDLPSPRDSARSRPVASWIHRERRTVTAVFIDLSSIEVDPDPEAGRSEVADRLEEVSDVIRAHGGRIEESVGDLVVGVFGLPAAHEDDPLRALRAVLSAREAVLGRTGATCGFRAAVETGEVVTGSDDGSRRSPSGPPITIAARLQQTAGQAEVLMGPTAMRLVQGSVIVAPAPDVDLRAWRVLEVDPHATILPRHLDTPMVGRVEELSRLRTSLSRVARVGTASMLTVIGEAGMGKSRLSRDFTDSVSDRALIAATTCLPDQEGGTFAPLHDLLIQTAGVSAWPELASRLEQSEDAMRSRDQVAGAIGLGPVVGSPQDLFIATRQVFESLTESEPLAAVIDDAHWAQETFLDLLEYLRENLKTPILFLCLARPELLERRPGWSARSARSDLLHLEPLGDEDIDDIVRVRSGVDLAPDTAREIAETAQGNPLFAEQLLAAFQNEETEGVPASLRSLLAMRIDRLGPGERDLLRCAAVAGDHLSEAALTALVPSDARPHLTRNLASLERRRLLDRSGAATLRFGHGLIRDAAYRSLTLTDRAHLHRRFAEWLEADAATRPLDLDIVVGHHLEQAVRCGRQAGADRPHEALAARAGEHLAEAGIRAFKNLDLPAAENLLTRARTLLSPDHRQRSLATQLLAEVSLPLGDHAQAQELLLEISEGADVELATKWSARVERGRSLCLTGPDPVTHEELSTLARQAFDFFERVEDDKGRAQSSFLQGQLARMVGRPGDVVSSARRSMGYADRCEAGREMLASRYLVIEGLIDGPDAVDHCVTEAESLASIDGAEHPIVILALARLHAMARRFDDARALIERARHILVERFRIRRLQMFVALSSAVVENLANDLEAAERAYREALPQARQGGERPLIAEISARLALLFATQGRVDEAATLADESRVVAPAENTIAQALSLAAMARTLPPEKLDEAATAMADAVERVPVEMSTLRADLLVERARLAEASGHRSDAREYADLALVLYEQKHNVAAAHNLRHSNHSLLADH